jgi:hypothetical protein
MLRSIESIRATLDVRGTPAAVATSPPPERIPIAAFKRDKSLVARYGMTYTVVRDLALKGRLRSYCDEDRERGRWTTHSDLVSYFEGMKKMGMKIPA